MTLYRPLVARIATRLWVAISVAAALFISRVYGGTGWALGPWRTETLAVMLVVVFWFEVWSLGVVDRAAIRLAGRLVARRAHRGRHA